MYVTGSQSWAAVVGEVGPPAEVRRDDTRMVVTLRGEQDMSTAAGVAEALARASSVGGCDVVVDLSGLLFMDAAIVGVLVGSREALRLQSRHLTLRAPSSFARRVLELCGLVGKDADGDILDRPEPHPDVQTLFEEGLLYIQPDGRTSWDACLTACPVDATTPADKVPTGLRNFLVETNRLLFADTPAS